MINGGYSETPDQWIENHDTERDEDLSDGEGSAADLADAQEREVTTCPSSSSQCSRCLACGTHIKRAGWCSVCGRDLGWPK